MEKRQKNGKGTYYYLKNTDYKNLTENNMKKVCNIYKGDFKNGKFEGRGVVSFSNGDSYEGEFRDDKKKDMARIILKMEKYLKVIFSKIISKVKEL